MLAESLPTSSLFAYSAMGMRNLSCEPLPLLNVIWSMAKSPRSGATRVQNTTRFYSLKRAVLALRMFHHQSSSLCLCFLLSFALVLCVPVCLVL